MIRNSTNGIGRIVAGVVGTRGFLPSTAYVVPALSSSSSPSSPSAAAAATCHPKHCMPLRWQSSLVLLCVLSRTVGCHGFTTSTSTTAGRNIVTNDMPSPRSVARMMATAKDSVEESPAPKRRGRPRKIKDSTPVEAPVAAASDATTKKKRGRPKKEPTADSVKETKKTKTVKGASSSSSANATKVSSPKKRKTTKAATDHQRQTDRDETPKLWNPDEHPDSYSECTDTLSGVV